MFGTKPKTPDATIVVGALDAYTQEQKRRRDERQAEAAAALIQLSAECAATQPPADLFRISKELETGKFIVLRWVNRVVSKWSYDCLYHYLERGHVQFEQRFPSAAAARAFIKAYIDPKTNLQGFDADGEPVAVSGGKSSDAQR